MNGSALSTVTFLNKKYIIRFWNDLCMSCTSYTLHLTPNQFMEVDDSAVQEAFCNVHIIP